VANTKQFLGLTNEEERFIELKLALATGVRRLRERRGLTQAELARRLGSSQSRVAKIEAADASVSVDLMVRSLLGIGATRDQIARIIRQTQRVRAA
jgi:transcriptional regulator with XRE-family HTH domain